MKTGLERLFALGILITLAATGLVACGKKGPPQPPAGVTEEFPKRYPRS